MRSTWRRRVPDDGATILTVFVVLLLAIPSPYVVGPLGAAGQPARILAMGLVLIWLGRRLATPRLATPSWPPVRTAMLVLLAAALVSYVAANLRPIDGAEARAADRGLLTLLAFLGVVLVAGDEIPSVDRLLTLLRRLVLGGAAVATLALVQFQTGRAFTEYLLPPGLVVNSDSLGVAERAGFLRPAGTALHPIEFGVAVAILLPLALHLALTDRHRHWFWRWYPVVVLAAAVPVSVSRSAVVCVAVAGLVMLPVLSRVERRLTILAALGMGALVYVTVPGMLGTLLGLFTGIGTDDSAASRTGSYGLALEYLARSPVVGRGFGTFLPEYRILDNQFLLTAIEMGLLGLAALLGLLAAGAWTALRVRRRTADPATGRLAQALLASLAAGTVSFALFDALSFPMVAGLVFLVLGLIGGLDRLVPRAPGGGEARDDPGAGSLSEAESSRGGSPRTPPGSPGSRTRPR